jgi:DnaJ-class molecular chaperone
VGAELEHVRQAMLRPVAVCHRCHGLGRARYISPMLTPEMQPEEPPHVCRICGGAGTLPVKAV